MPGSGNAIISDVGILIGLHGGISLDEGSGKLINKQINEIVEKINKRNKFTIAIDADTSRIKSSIEDAVKKMGPIKVQVDADVTGRGVSKGSTQTTTRKSKASGKQEDPLKNMAAYAQRLNKLGVSAINMDKTSEAYKNTVQLIRSIRGEYKKLQDAFLASEDSLTMGLTSHKKIKEFINKQQPILMGQVKGGKAQDKLFDDTVTSLSKVAAQIGHLKAENIQLDESSDVYKHNIKEIESLTKAYHELETAVLSTEKARNLGFNGSGDISKYIDSDKGMVATRKAIAKANDRVFAQEIAKEESNKKQSEKEYQTLLKDFISNGVAKRKLYEKQLGLDPNSQEYVNWVSDLDSVSAAHQRLQAEIKETQRFKDELEKSNAGKVFRGEKAETPSQYLNRMMVESPEIQSASRSLQLAKTNFVKNDFSDKLSQLAKYQSELNILNGKILTFDTGSKTGQEVQKNLDELKGKIHLLRKEILQFPSDIKGDIFDDAALTKHVNGLDNVKKSMMSVAQASDKLKATYGEVTNAGQYSYINEPDPKKEGRDEKFGQGVYDAHKRYVEAMSALQKWKKDNKESEFDYSNLDSTYLESHKKQVKEFREHFDAAREAKQSLDSELKNDRAIRKYAAKIGDFRHKAERTASPAYLKKVDELFEKAKSGAYEGGVKQLVSDFVQLQNEGEATGQIYETLGQKISRVFKEKFGYAAMALLANEARKALSEVYSNVIDIDSAMTELKKVTNETDEVYRKFLDGASDRAKKLGSGLADTIRATADFARLGYSLEESSGLADAALVYKNVGDGIQNISDASESLISTMKAFENAVENPMEIVDKFNEVGNNFPISSKGVGDALMRSASALASANNTLDESIALVTAANAVVQDPEKVGKQKCPTV